MLIDRDKIAEAKEKLGDQNAFLIASELGLPDFDEQRLRACCPYHHEDTASFIYDRKRHMFHCFGCQKNADLIDVLMQNGSTYLEACQKLFEMADVPYVFGEVGIKTRSSYRYPTPVVSEDKSIVHAYLEKRKISAATADYVDIGQDDKGNIVFYYYDLNDVLTNVKYRPSHKVTKSSKESKCWFQKNADTTPLLFNMNRVNTAFPLLICEGEIDCMAAIEAGYQNAVSVPMGAGNFGWIEECWDWLEQFDSIIIAADNDDPGVKMQKECVYRLGSWRTKFVEIPHTITAANGKTVAVKDINEVLYYAGKDEVMRLISSAKDSPVDSVMDFSDIKNIDVDEIMGVKTGIDALDSKIMKLFYGSMTIVTGVNGSGKSSFLSQIICQCLEQDENAFLYSGELPNFQSKNWINYILAGQRHLSQYESNGAVYWKASYEAQEQINEFYRGRLFIYKDGYDHKASSILKSMEDNIRKYGVKLLIIDNLTSVNLENNDDNKYSKQAEFVEALIDMAKKFNVAVVLVVHPHKIETMRRLTKMDVQGISAIIDLAHRILSLYRVTAADKEGIPKKNGQGYSKPPIKYDVLCDILKDRMLGTEGQSVGLYYDRPSRRFFTTEEDLDYQYKWDRNEYNSSLPFPPPQLIDREEEVYGAKCS